MPLRLLDILDKGPLRLLNNNTLQEMVQTAWNPIEVEEDSQVALEVRWDQKKKKGQSGNFLEKLLHWRDCDWKSWKVNVCGNERQ